MNYELEVEAVLSPRLQAVLALVPPGTTAADIGTDHGFLALELSKICPRVVATDVHQGPYAIACRAVKQQGAEAQISVRLGNGLEPLEPGEVETVIMAGMGGNTILDILEDGNLAGVEHLVLQPQSFAPELRIWLNEHGWYLREEKLVQEGRHLYLIMAAARGKESQKFFRRWGPRLWEKQDPLWPEYLRRLQKESEQIIAGAEQSQKPLRTELKVRIQFYQDLRRQIEQILKVKG